jgi:hypothetical protein
MAIGVLQIAGQGLQRERSCYAVKTRGLGVSQNEWKFAALRNPRTSSAGIGLPKK